MGLRGHEIATTVRLITETCCVCGTPFSIVAGLHEQLQRNHNWFYCPVGHGQRYNAQTEAERLREKLMDAQSRNTSLSSQLRNTNGLLDVAEKAKRKLEKRARAGLCSHCRRHFMNLERHMDSKHSEQ